MLTRGADPLGARDTGHPPARRHLTRRFLGRPTSGAAFAAASTRDVLHLVAAELDLRSVLSPAERARCAALTRPADQEDFLAARVLARLLLLRRHLPGESLAALTTFTVTQQCLRCTGPHGQPVVELPDTHVSWSHSYGFVAAAVGPAPVGVDVEPVAGRPGRTSAAGVRPWVRSEALLKWGHGDLDRALTWQAELSGSVSQRGRRYRLSSDSRPVACRGLVLRGPTVVVTDGPRSPAFACSVAASSRARWVDLSASSRTG